MIADALQKLDDAISELEIAGEDMVRFDEKLKDCQVRLSKVLIREEKEDAGRREDDQG